MRHSGKLDEALEAVWTDTGEKVKFDENGEPIDEIQKPIDQDNNLSDIIRMSLGGSVEKNSLECVVQAFNCSVQGEDGVSQNQTGHKKINLHRHKLTGQIRNPPSMLRTLMITKGSKNEYYKFIYLIYFYVKKAFF